MKTLIKELEGNIKQSNTTLLCRGHEHSELPVELSVFIPRKKWSIVLTPDTEEQYVKNILGLQPSSEYYKA